VGYTPTPTLVYSCGNVCLLIDSYMADCVSGVFIISRDSKSMVLVPTEVPMSIVAFYYSVSLL